MIDIINDCRQIVEGHQLKLVKHNDYNIYKLLNVTQKEVQMCRILADFLNPDGNHGEGSKYLKVFLQKVLGKKVSDSELCEARVYTEYPITNDRRIDIVISYRGYFIPIEVKIKAKDQKSQCYDYYIFAKAKDNETFIVYLTISGKEPSNYSLRGKSGEGLDKRNIRCISFNEDIMGWLNEIKEIASNEMIPLIEQYIGAVNDFIDREDEDYIMSLTNKLIASSGSLKTALEIEKYMSKAKSELMKKVFDELKCQINKKLSTEYNLELEEKSNYLCYEELALEDFYAHGVSTHPGLNYVIKSVNLGDNLSLWLRIEVDNRIYASLCVYDYSAESNSENGIGKQCDEISDELWNKLHDFIELPKEKGYGWIVAWKYLPTGSDSSRKDKDIDSVPNFKIMNDAAINLADEQKRKEFVNKSIETIKDTILNLIKVK